MRRSLLSCVVFAFAVACGRSEQQAAAPPAPAQDGKVTDLADRYLSAYLDRNPDTATYYGIPGRHHDRLPDNSLASLKEWEAKEDGWFDEARAIDPAHVQQESTRATYAILREALESSVQSRVCRYELWNVSQMTGWQVNFGYLLTIQPVGSADARREALARWQALPQYLDTEIANLREGMAAGYTSPKLAVRIVIDQIAALLKSSAADSPFLSPASRDSDRAFKAEFSALYRDRIRGALRAYHDFLEKEYLPAAREEIAITGNRDGAACYTAALRGFSTLPVTPEEVHTTGLTEIDRLTTAMRAIAERSFGTPDVTGLLQKVRTDREYLFKSREELISYSQAALARAKQAIPGWFGLLPKADVSIEPYPKFREKNAANEYNAPAEDGSRPGLFYINAYQAEKKSRAPAESTAFHETIPGHHLQIAIALERKEGHPIGRYINNSGFAEGWGLYAEQLADEMKLYSSDLDRLGMLSSQAFRAARLVVDSGIHSKGWSRDQAIAYMLAHTAEPADDIAAEVDRYIVWPGQATAYMLGKLQILKAREEARTTMGERFDIKAFHDRVLEDGAVPVTFLTSKIHAWAMMPR
jgi:uncharacterized protein (DUF885 family)